MSVLSLEMSVLSINYYQFQIIEFNEDASLNYKTSGDAFSRIGRLLIYVLSHV